MVKQLISSASITLQDLSDAIISGTQPTNPKLDQLWIKRTDGKPDELYRWNGTAWVDQTLDLGKLDPDADNKIEDHEKTIGNMVDDAKIDITERQEVKNKLTPILGVVPNDTGYTLPDATGLFNSGIGEVYSVLKSAQNVGIKTGDTLYAAVVTNYNNLRDYLNGLTPKPWDVSVTNKNTPITVVPADWRVKWLDYYKSVQALTVAVQTKLQGSIDGIQGLRNLILNSKRLISTTDYLVAEYFLSEDFVEGQDYTLSIKGSIPNGQKFSIHQFDGSGNAWAGNADTQFLNGSYYLTFKSKKFMTGNTRVLRVYNDPSNTTTAIVEWVALYKGTKPFDWSVAPEDNNVGGVNLFVDSEFNYTTNWVWSTLRGKFETGIMPNGVKNYNITIPLGNTGYSDLYQYVEVEPNKEYTFSCNAGGALSTLLVEKNSQKENTAIFKDNRKNFNENLDMSSPRSTFTYTFKTQPDTKFIQFIVRVNGRTEYDVTGRVALPKLERGTTASEWTPNPFDTSNGEILIQGSSFDQTDKRRILTVNGNDVYSESTGRGLRLVTLKRTSLEVVENILYDVYGSATERTNLATKLNSLGEDVIITLTSYDAIVWDTNLRNAMINIGGSGVDATGRTPYAFIGMKGLGRYNGLEQYTGVGSLFGLAKISAKVKNGMIEGVNNNTGASDAIVRQDLRLTAPLPTSISLDSNGITASTTTAGKYARLDYRGLYIAGGAIQIDGGLSEAQLASGVTNKFTYIDSTGVYTGKVVAGQIQGGTITGVTINVDTDLQVGNTINVGKFGETTLKMIRFNSTANISNHGSMGEIINISAENTHITDGYVNIGNVSYGTWLYGTINVTNATFVGGVPAVFG